MSTSRGNLWRSFGGLLAVLTALSPGPARAEVVELAPGVGGPVTEGGEQNGGPGNEQPTVVHLEKNGTRYVVTIFMSSAVAEEEAPWQCKCTSLALSPTAPPRIVADAIQLTHHKSNRPCNHPKAATDGKVIVWTYGQNEKRGGNTRTYVSAVDELCNTVAERIRISDDDRNNEGAPDLVWNSGQRFTAGYLSTGGDDERSIAVGVDADASSGAVVLAKRWAQVVVRPSNIGRPALLPMPGDRTLFCAARGDERPPEDGVACGLLDAAAGKVTWRRLIAASSKEQKVFMNQPSLAALAGGRVALQVIESDGGGRRKNTKGRSKTHLYTMFPTDVAPNLLYKVANLGPYQAHSAVCAGAYGPDGAIMTGVFDASITGSGLATMTFTSYEAQAKKLVLDPRVVGAHDGDAGYMANIYGGNPNKQGREFMRCIGDVPNPGHGVAGGFMPESKTLFLAPYTGKKPSEPKNALFLGVLPGHTPGLPLPPFDPAGGAGEVGMPEVSEAPELPPDPTAGAGEAPAPMRMGSNLPMGQRKELGCAAAPATGQGGALAVVLALLGLAIVGRRRAWLAALLSIGCGSGEIVLDPEGRLAAQRAERERMEADRKADAGARDTPDGGTRRLDAAAPSPDGPAGPGPGNPAARAFFDANVAPALTRECASCHDASQPGLGPDFLGLAAGEYYPRLKADTRLVGTTPAASLLFTKGAHEGPAWSSDGGAAVSAWITMEAGGGTGGAGGGTGGTGGTGGAGGNGVGGTVDAGLDAFGRCMSLPVWNITGMPDLAQQNTTQGRCFACHSTGTGGAFLAESSDETFNASRMRPFILKLVLPTMNPDGTLHDLVVSTRFRDKGLPGSQHPQYVLTDERAAALVDFVDMTHALWSQGGCP